MPTLFRNFILFILALLVIAGVLSTFQMGGATAERIDVGKLITQVRSGEVRRIEIKGDSLLIELKSGAKEVAQKESGESLSSLLKNYGVAPEAVQGIEVAVKRQSGFGYWISVLLPFLIPFFLIGLVIFFMMRQVQGVNNRAMSFGQSGAREVTPEAKNRVAFKDVAGLEESKEELREIVEFLKNPKKFTVLGAKIPKGVLLMGSPGTGKTLLARAVAGEANVPFFHIAGSEFVEMFVGVGASRVRDLFENAKKNAPSIIFIDEIDAIGGKRGMIIGGGHTEQEQTLNQLMVEMDGFDPNVGIIIMAATNRPETLDFALLRPGRFDRHVVVPRPDVKGREEILKVHARKKPLAENANLTAIAKGTPGFVGADLENLLNEAALKAAQKEQETITNSDLEEAKDKIIMGGAERKSMVMSPAVKKVTAYHEAGHTLVAKFVPGNDPVHKVTIIPRGMSLGLTGTLPEEERHNYTKSYLEALLPMMMGGRCAEELVFKDISTGARNDIERATELASNMVKKWGMSEKLGPLNYGKDREHEYLGFQIQGAQDYSEKTAQTIDEEKKQIIDKAYRKATDVLAANRNILEALASALLEKETLTGEEVNNIVKQFKISQAN